MILKTQVPLSETLEHVLKLLWHRFYEKPTRRPPARGEATPLSGSWQQLFTLPCVSSVSIQIVFSTSTQKKFNSNKKQPLFLIVF